MTNMVGDLPGMGTVWYHEGGIENILSLAKVKNRYRITYDSHNGNNVDVHLNEGKIRRFRESHTGLYYSDMRE